MLTHKFYIAVFTDELVPMEEEGTVYVTGTFVPCLLIPHFSGDGYEVSWADVRKYTLVLLPLGAFPGGKPADKSEWNVEIIQENLLWAPAPGFTIQSREEYETEHADVIAASTGLQPHVAVPDGRDPEG